MIWNPPIDMGMRIVESEYLVDQVEDWSGCRSRSRAERRRRQGHRQNVRVINVPRKEVVVVGDMMIVHPAVAAQFRREMQARIDFTTEQVIRNAW